MVELSRILSRLGFTHEWLIIRHGGSVQGPYRREADARRDFAGLRGASLYWRRAWCGGWKSDAYTPWPGKGDPPWWTTGETSWL